jgi:hypothetical protein
MKVVYLAPQRRRLCFAQGARMALNVFVGSFIVAALIYVAMTIRRTTGAGKRE